MNDGDRKTRTDPERDQVVEIDALAERHAGAGDHSFASAGGFERADEDPRPISAIPEGELLVGFGE